MSKLVFRRGGGGWKEWRKGAQLGSKKERRLGRRNGRKVHS